MADLSSLSFRPAGLGGFNKKDVIAYVKTLSDQHAAALKRLERSLSDAEKQNAALDEKLAACEAERNALSSRYNDTDAELSDLRALYNAAQSEVDSLRASLAETEKALREAAQRADALEKENADLRGEKEAADTVLSRLEKEKQAVTELELEARLRARDSEASARSRIAAIITAYQQEFSEAKDAFRHYKSSADKLIVSTEEQLKDMLSLFGELESELELSEKAFEKLSADPLDTND